MLRQNSRKGMEMAQDEAMIVTAEISSVDEIISFKERTKHVFKCKGTGSEQQCIYWAPSPTKLNVGDTVQVKGRFKDNIFYVGKCLS